MQKETTKLMPVAEGLGVAAATTAHWVQQWVLNMRRNVWAVDKDFEKRDGNLGAMGFEELHPRVKDPTKALILGSGPSLHLADDIIHKWKGILVAGATNATWAAAHGRIPDFIFASDANQDSAKALGDFPWDMRKTFLVCSPDNHPDVISKWQVEGRRMWFLSMMSPIDGSLKPEREIYNVFQQMLFPEVRTWGFMAGSTPTTALQMIWFWGYLRGLRTMFTLGTDFCYGSKLQRHLRWEWEAERGAWRQTGDGKQIELPGEQIFEVDGRKTSSQMLNYRENYHKVVALNHMSLYDCSGGLVKYVPHADIEEVIKSSGRSYKPLSPKEVKECLSPYVQEQIAQRTERAQQDSTSGPSSKPAHTSSIFDTLKVSYREPSQSLLLSEEDSTPEKPSGTEEGQLDLPFEPSNPA